VVALSVKVRAPVTAPVALGLKVTLTVQLLFAANEPEQLLLSVKSPLAAIEPMVSGPVPEFVSVTDLDALLVPTAWSPKLRLAGLTAAVPPEASKT
jgi:hypothetical protein